MVEETTTPHEATAIHVVEETTVTAEVEVTVTAMATEAMIATQVTMQRHQLGTEKEVTEITDEVIQEETAI